jgi:hypothetical protein
MRHPDTGNQEAIGAKALSLCRTQQTGSCQLRLPKPRSSTVGDNERNRRVDGMERLR